MYTRPGQQADDEMVRENNSEPHCANCPHMIWTHKFMAMNQNEMTCSVPECHCVGWVKRV